MNVNDRIRALGEQLKDRLDPGLVNYALEYIDCSESVLAFETLCDYIGDYDVLITKDEYSQVIELVRDIGVELTNRYLYVNPDK